MLGVCGLVLEARPMNATPQGTIDPNAGGAEPRAGAEAVPVWFFLFALLLAFWAMVSFDQHGGWFDQRIYAPDRSIEEVESHQPQSSEDGCFAEGRRLYGMNCAPCHMDNGAGNPGNGCPPLAGSEWLAAPGAGRVVRIISKGLTGPVEVKGQAYGSGTMTPIGDQMAGDEQQKAETIAAILCYARKAFASNSVPLSVQQVLSIRDQIKPRSSYFTAEELKAIPENE